MIRTQKNGICNIVGAIYSFIVLSIAAAALIFCAADSLLILTWR